MAKAQWGNSKRDRTALDRTAEALVGVLGVDAVRRDRGVGAETTYRVGGAVRVGVSLPADVDFTALAEALSATENQHILVVGKGSNLLVADAGFEGVGIWLARSFDWLKISGVGLCVGGAASLAVVARKSAAAGLSGFEWAVGVPGSVGGAVRMNAGGHGSDMAASVVAAQVADLRSGIVERWDTQRLRFGYRSSGLAPHHLVLSAELLLENGNVASAQAQIAEIVSWRRNNQPGGQNAGSVFTNPTGHSAGHLIEAAGLKGLRHGSCEVSQKHANFFVVDHNGSADDVFALMCEVFQAVKLKFAVDLIPETKLVGFAPGPWDDPGSWN
ncbi:MAG: UDP-N-acetylmuramate dehydrogenase [bacterium]|nr:UDP-N-acetylmuramate dehydrogenase [bacterium]